MVKFHLKFLFGFGFAICLFLGFGNSVTFAASNIDHTGTNHWAWNDVAGWIDFCDVNTAGNACVLSMTVSDTKVNGSASTSIGFIELDCAVSDVCGSGAGNWFVSNDGQGKLAGWAWSNTIGWISFCGNILGGSTYDAAQSTWRCPASPTYQVTITSSGDFMGYAWNDVVGWISFNCANQLTCLTIDYRVRTTWVAPPVLLPAAELTSSTFDTCAFSIPPADCGAVPNSIVWQGTLPSGGSAGLVRFRIASSNCSNGATNPPACNVSTWTFFGPDFLDLNSFYAASIMDPSGLRSESIPINQANHLNKRYFRYKLYLNPCNACAAPKSPAIKGVILNWSP